MDPNLQNWEREIGQLKLLLPLIILLTGLQALACGVWAQSLARARGHSASKWFWIGFFMSVAGVIGAGKLPNVFYSSDGCRVRGLCTWFCALVNGCNATDNQQEEGE